MSDSWESDGASQNQTHSSPVYSQTFDRGEKYRDDRNWRHSGDHRGRGGGGYEGRRNYHKDNEFSSWDEANVSGSRQSNDGGRFNRGQGRGRGGNFENSRRQNNYDSEDSTTITVKSSDVGKVIGKGGSKIRELQDESGAYIQIGKPSEEDYGETTSVMLRGSDESVTKAKYLISVLLQSLNERFSGNSRGNL